MPGSTQKTHSKERRTSLNLAASASTWTALQFFDGGAVKLIPSDEAKDD